MGKSGNHEVLFLQYSQSSQDFVASYFNTNDYTTGFYTVGITEGAYSLMMGFMISLVCYNNLGKLFYDDILSS